MTPQRTPLILLPGMLCDARLWHHQVTHLSDIADIHIPALTEHTSIAALAKHVLKGAPERFALAGLSMGGYVAFEIIRQAPERVEKLALIATSARPDTLDQTEIRKRLMSLAEHGKFKGVTPRLLPSLIYHEKARNDEELCQLVMDMAAETGQEAFVRQEEAVINRPDSRPALADISCDTLIICGDHDQRTPLECSREMEKAIPNSELHIFEDCGHLPPLEKPEETTELMREWLTE